MEQKTELNWEEMKKLIRDNNCAECGSPIDIHMNPELGEPEVWCNTCRANRGYIAKTTYTEDFRRGMVVHPSIQQNIERRMLINRPGALHMIKARYPDMEMDDPSAGLFLLDCVRLSLDPFLGEIIPMTFKVTVRSTGEKRRIVQPIITEDGYLSLASRACPGDFVGPPKTMRIEEYLASQPEYKDRPYEEVKTIAGDIKLDMCHDRNAYLWVAIGKRKDQEEKATYGWYKTSEEGRVAKGLPGNQARVRAIKRWVREVFPEAKANMQVMTAEWMERAEGVPELIEVIEAEYRLLESPLSETEGDDKFGGEDNKGEEAGDEPQATNLESPKVKGPQKNRGVSAARDPDTIITLNDLYKACHDDFTVIVNGESRQMQPSDVVKELGYTSQAMIAETPPDCYRKIVAARA